MSSNYTWQQTFYTHAVLRRFGNQDGHLSLKGPSRVAIGRKRGWNRLPHEVSQPGPRPGYNLYSLATFHWNFFVYRAPGFRYQIELSNVTVIKKICAFAVSGGGYAASKSISIALWSQLKYRHHQWASRLSWFVRSYRIPWKPAFSCKGTSGTWPSLPCPYVPLHYWCLRNNSTVYHCVRVIQSVAVASA